jgi:transposase InsO family protein
LLVKEGYKVSDICNTLKLSRSSYYRKKNKNGLRDRLENTVETERKKIIEMIKTLKSEHPFWGYRRVRAYLKNKYKIIISLKRTYLMMKESGLLVDVKRYKVKRTITREKPRAEHKNHWWGTDMTKFFVNNVGWLYLVIVIDWYTKKVIGHKLNMRSKTEDWIEALEMAVTNECPLGCREYGINLMSDNGSQPTSIKYLNAVNILGINHITTSYNNPKGNADTERFLRTFKEEVVWINDFDSISEATKAVEDFIFFYNNEYPHSTLNYKSPVEFEWWLKNAA